MYIISHPLTQEPKPRYLLSLVSIAREVAGSGKGDTRMDQKGKQVKTIPPMTREQWEKMPAVFKYFHPWEVASQPLTIRIDNTYQDGQA
jgi:hypothetical protein